MEPRVDWSCYVWERQREFRIQTRCRHGGAAKQRGRVHPVVGKTNTNLAGWEMLRPQRLHWMSKGWGWPEATARWGWAFSQVAHRGGEWRSQGTFAAGSVSLCPMPVHIPWAPAPSPTANQTGRFADKHPRSSPRSVSQVGHLASSALAPALPGNRRCHGSAWILHFGIKQWRTWSRTSLGP